MTHTILFFSAYLQPSKKHIQWTLPRSTQTDSPKEPLCLSGKSGLQLQQRLQTSRKPLPNMSSEWAVVQHSTVMHTWVVWWCFYPYADCSGSGTLPDDKKLGRHFSLPVYSFSIKNYCGPPINIQIWCPFPYPHYYSAVKCPRITRIDNGIVKGTNNTYGARVRFSCLTGFKLIGSKIRHCQQDQKWSGREAVCASELGNLSPAMKTVTKVTLFLYLQRLTAVIQAPSIMDS